MLRSSSNPVPAIPAGFSLVEMLTVIAVMGILSAMAIPQFQEIREAAQISKDQNNAQQIVSMYHSAQSLGLDFDGTDKMSTIDKVVTGGTVERGTFEGTFFGLPHLTPIQKQRAANYIIITGGALQYIGTGAGDD